MFKWLRELFSSKPRMDSRLRGNDGEGEDSQMDSRLRGNDGVGAVVRQTDLVSAQNSGNDGDESGNDGEEDQEIVQVPITDSIDLHTFSPKETADVTATYLEEAHQANFREVRIIHGKGKGVQREIIHSLLRRHPLVQSFQLAPPERGGWGATLVTLRDK